MRQTHSQLLAWQHCRQADLCSAIFSGNVWGASCSQWPRRQPLQPAAFHMWHPTPTAAHPLPATMLSPQ